MRKKIVLLLSFCLLFFIPFNSIAESKSVPKGNLEGAITWQYNEFIGTKPDVGADVYLIPKKLKKGSLTTDKLIKVADKKIKAESVGIHFASVNGRGDYKIKGIEQGEYIILVISQKTFRDFLTDYNDKTANKLLKPYIKDWKNMTDGTLQMFKSVAEEITILPNETNDYSFDFGYTDR